MVGECGGILMNKNLKSAVVGAVLFVVLFMVVKCVVDGVGSAFSMPNVVGAVVSGLIYFALMFMWGTNPKR